jgi:hypothetical protein
MFAGDRQDEGRIAVWLLAPPGLQEMRRHLTWNVFHATPPCAGVRGSVGLEVELDAP